MSKIRTDDTYYNDIADEINILTGEDKRYKSSELAGGIANLPKTEDKTFGRDIPTLTVNPDKIELTVDSPNTTATITYDGDGILSVDLDEEGKKIATVSISGKTLNINNKDKVEGSGKIIINASKGIAFRGAKNTLNINAKYTKTIIHFRASNGSMNGEKQYEAEEGMTWRQFINSKYNIDGFHISGNIIYSDKNNDWGEFDSIRPDDAIENNKLYHYSAQK